jgi:hypothetical protein
LCAEAIFSQPLRGGPTRLLEWEILLPTLADVEGALSSLAETGALVESTPTGGLAHDPWDVGVRFRALDPQAL